MGRPDGRLAILGWLLGVFGATTLEAVTWNVATTTGVMQQPTSHYYHFCYGLQVGIVSDSERLGGMIQYIERPEFVASGFADKEYTLAALITTKLTKSSGRGLYGGFGWGQLTGYIEATDSTTFSEPRRVYTVQGPAAMVEYAWQWQRLEAAIGHETLIGYVNKQQLESLVAWPYNFFGLRLGYRW